MTLTKDATTPTDPGSESVEVLFMIFCTFTMFWMVQGAGLFYGGLTRSKSALIQVAYSFVTLAITSVQWFLFGYSLVFSDDGNSFIGSLKYACYKHLDLQQGLSGAGEPGIGSGSPLQELCQSVFECMFAAVTVSLLIGCVAERGRLVPAVIFTFIWTTLVYDPIAYWTWNMNGWAYRLGVLDYAGGTPVHVSAGLSALAYSQMLGKRLGFGTPQLNYRPHNTVLVVVGTAFLWAGWVGFNSGSGAYPGLNAVLSLINSQISASIGGITWAYLDYRLDHKWSVVGFCSGIVSGLVIVTPAAGFIKPWAAVIFGLCGGFICNMATKVKFYLDIDDALDVLAIHGIGGFSGTILTGVFSQFNAQMEFIPDWSVWSKHTVKQVFLQALGTTVAGLYAFIMTVVILFCLSKFEGLHLRVMPSEEIVGLDLSEHDEQAYSNLELVSSSDDVAALAQLDGNVLSSHRVFDTSLNFQDDMDANGIIEGYDYSTDDDGQHSHHRQQPSNKHSASPLTGEPGETGTDDVLQTQVHDDTRSINTYGALNEAQAQMQHRVRPLLDRD